MPLSSGAPGRRQGPRRAGNRRQQPWHWRHRLWRRQRPMPALPCQQAGCCCLTHTHGGWQLRSSLRARCSKFGRLQTFLSGLSRQLHVGYRLGLIIELFQRPERSAGSLRGLAEQKGRHALRPASTAPLDQVVPFRRATLRCTCARGGSCRPYRASPTRPGRQNSPASCCQLLSPAPPASGQNCGYLSPS